ncbi:MAG TPA: hydroxymethylbilane synthase [Tepidisphaeraceae bacterium]|jgi:hydroxymethylbilane synthase|nr:hydroxymethylbilane synthase [Tepidisphaeraceae bacterium]
MALIRLGTRGSLLARSQSAIVAGEIQRIHPDIQVQTIIINTTGDQITDRPLYEAGGKGLFVKELEQALLAGQIDFAVHSCKDLPVTMPLVDQSDLILAAIPARLDSRDVLICRHAAAIRQLPPGAAVATGSLRRRCQLLACRSDLRIQAVRGNIDTRIKKLRAGEFDAMVLAMAGITRAELFDSSLMHPLSPDEILCAPGQGALALQCRRDDAWTREILRILDDPLSRMAIEAERAVVAALHGDCHSPIAALARIDGQTLHLRAVVGRRDGNPPVISARSLSPTSQSREVVAAVVEQLIAQGAPAMLKDD